MIASRTIAAAQRLRLWTNNEQPVDNPVREGLPTTSIQKHRRTGCFFRVVAQVACGCAR
jgi:hypothetical protein